MARTRPRSKGPVTRGVRPGGRSARVVESVFSTTRNELARVGYSRLTIEVVARKAGVNKTTVYRRWPTKASLVIAAISGALVFELAPPQPTPRDGVAPGRATLRDDLLTLAHRLDAWVRTPEGTAVTRALAVELHQPEVLAMARATKLRVKEQWTAAVRRAIDRGEVPASTDPDLLFEVLTGTLVDAFVRVTHVVDERFLASIVDLVVAGAVHGGAVAPARAPPRRR